MKDDKYDDFFKDRNITSLDKKKSFRKAFFNSFKDEIESLPSSVHTVIISSEQLHSRTCTLEEVSNVKMLLSCFFDEIKIIYYIREQCATAASLYSTGIKEGITETFKHALKSCNPNNTYYNYYNMLSNWRDVFGAKNLTATVYDKSSLKNGDLVEDSFSLIDPSLYKYIIKDIAKANTSLNEAGQFLGLAINHTFPRHLESGELSPLNLKRKKAIQSIKQSFRGAGRLMSASEYEKIYTAFEHSNIQLNEEFLGGSKGENCFKKDPPRASHNGITLNEDDLPKLVHLFKSFASNSLNLPDHYADFFRDLALSLEDKDLESAHKLMELAHKVRPNGPVIQKHLDTYKRKLKMD